MNAKSCCCLPKWRFLSDFAAKQQRSPALSHFGRASKHLGMFLLLFEEGGAGGGARKAFMLWVVVGIVREREEKQ